jgi:hypothetical protein
VLLAGALAFAAGFAIDVLAVVWTRRVVRRDVAVASLVSMALGAAQVAGIGAGARDWRLACCFFAGCGVGTAVSLWRAKT